MFMSTIGLAFVLEGSAIPFGVVKLKRSMWEFPQKFYDRGNSNTDL